MRIAGFSNAKRNPRALIKEVRENPEPALILDKDCADFSPFV